MKRRNFILKGAAATAGVSLLEGTLAKANAPDYMPIVKKKMAGGDYLPYYEEREITEPVTLCDDRGQLNPDAVGWSRTPMTRANMKGHWPRKKKWNFWNWISPDFVFSVTLADIDYAAFCAGTFTDFKTKEHFQSMAIKRGGTLGMPETVEESVGFKGGKTEYVFDHKGDQVKIDYTGKTRDNKILSADFVLKKPEGHESLNIVVPWSRSRFQMNSKHNTLPCEGTVKVGDKTYVMDPAECHGVQDFGRGMWPYRTYWNWAVCTGVQDGNLIGVNMGDKWTTGTGSNENGIMFNGKLHKIMEDLKWEYDARDWMKPWRMRTMHSDMLDMTLTPITVETTKVGIGVIATSGACSFGHWNGVLKFDGQTVDVKNLIGWAEEFSHKW